MTRDTYPPPPPPRQTRPLRIAKRGELFEVDDLALPGSPAVGRGRTMLEAIGDWFHANQGRHGYVLEVDPSASEAENERRRRELAKR